MKTIQLIKPIKLIGTTLLATAWLSCSGGDSPESEVIQEISSTILFEDSMTGDWQEKWFLDGKKATLRNSEAGLYFSGGTVTKPQDPEAYHAHHAVLWTKREFEGDLRISFEMTREDTSDYGNTLLYIHAQGLGTEAFPKDITQWNDFREISAMNKYFTNMELWSLSFRENIRARRYPLQSADPDTEPVGGTVFPYVDYVGMIPGKTYRVLVEKRGPTMTLRLADKETGELYANHTWDMTVVSKDGKSRAPVLEKGRIGLRHMSTKQFTYKNFKVEQL